ncbi:MAG: HAMP domain-containing histidine kinase [Ktedonobacteraceae bacterium]|nr:HAMP domain-containing histidine kinase [Ktedonobacteraceae bacterium]
MQSLFSRVGLRVKLQMSYLLVTLGTILTLTFVVALVVQNYFYNVQLERLNLEAQYYSQRIERLYLLVGQNWDNLQSSISETGDPVILVITDATGRQILCSEPTFVSQANCHDPRLKSALSKALQGSEESGYLQVSVKNSAVSSQYISVPLNKGNQVIGAMFLSEPTQSSVFLQQVNLAIFVAGVVVALIVILFSVLLARRLTRPLESLTLAAEQVRQGKYTQRVASPTSLDELGRLTLTFNAMADTIEADVNELRRQEQVRRDLLANIAHDLATPLTAIQGFSEALADDLILDPAARQETAQRIGREVQRLHRLVADIQQMSALESGHARLDLAPLNMHALVDETVAVIVPECEQGGIATRNEIAAETPPVLADSDRITQVLLNLLDNARHHTPCNGSITISAVQEGKMLKITVSDTGVGIDPTDLPHIFERFYRADRSRTGKTGGSGLGLSIVRAIITAHGGKVWAESTLGQGTRISFSLPLAVP